jgi:hypothetical protein
MRSEQPPAWFAKSAPHANGLVERASAEKATPEQRLAGVRSEIWSLSDEPLIELVGLSRSLRRPERRALAAEPRAYSRPPVCEIRREGVQNP